MARSIASRQELTSILADCSSTILSAAGQGPTQVLAKTMERIINIRLNAYTESENIPVSQPVGFRPCYSVEDQGTYLFQEMEEAFQDKKSELAVYWR